MTRSPARSSSAATAGNLLRWIGIAALAGAFLAMLGPFGSYTNSGPAKLAGYWIGATLLGLVLYGSAHLIIAATASRSSVGWWSAVVAAALLASVPEALATRAAAFWLWPDLAQRGLPLGLWFGQTATIGLMLMIGANFIGGRWASAPQDQRAPPPSANSREISLEGDVLALQMEDHYVRVHRPAQSELILMPLGRAIERVGTDGLRTHRSWWVASHAVKAWEGDARSMRLILSNGLVAPVARSAVARLKAAGWIADTDTAAG